jgi:hypothetical protein
MTKAYLEFDEEIREKYRELDLKHLKEVEFDGKGHAEFFVDIVRKKQIFQSIPFSDFKMSHEMDCITADMKYITAILFLLRPYINNPHHDDGQYYQTIGDRRYLMHTTFGLQAAYNFWDRLGDLLWYFFPSTLAERDIYFDRIIGFIDAPYNATDSYNSLLKLYKEEVKPVLQVRKEAVHYFQPECKHYWGNIEDRTDEGMRKSYEEKFGYTDLMYNQLGITHKAYELTLKLIDELPNK